MQLHNIEDTINSESIDMQNLKQLKIKYPNIQIIAIMS